MNDVSKNEELEKFLEKNRTRIMESLALGFILYAGLLFFLHFFIGNKVYPLAGLYALWTPAISNFVLLKNTKSTNIPKENFINKLIVFV